ncbi:MAG: glycosyltransferase family 2 protein [Nanoarchaeota archaeon]|nr:glycosyltransferase family 2 protein [Nanoarchaeota archaeon]
MAKPRISVIMPAYNAEKFISETIKSIINQTFKDWELIVIADAPTDRTIEIVKNYQKKEKRIKLILLKKNCGPAYARNIGMKKARGEYIANLDADDLADRKRLGLQYSFLEKNPLYFLVGCSFSYIDEKGKYLGKDHNQHEMSKEHLEWAKKIPNSSIMFKKNKKFSYKPNLSPVEDFEFLLNALFQNKKIKVLNDSLVYYRIHSYSLTTRENLGAYQLSEKIISVYKSYSSSLEKREELLKKLKMKDIKNNFSDKITLKRLLSALYESNKPEKYRILARKFIFRNPLYFRKEIVYYFISYLKKR